MAIIGVYNAKKKLAAELAVDASGVTIHRADEPGRRDLEKVVERLNRDGAPWRKESFTDKNETGVGFERVFTSDKKFPEAVAAFFRSSGNAARVFDDPKRAELWRLLYIVPIENDLRTGLLTNLTAMSNEEIDDLLAQFRKTATKLGSLKSDDHVPPVVS